MIGKKAQGGDYLAFVVFVFFLLFFSVLSIWVIKPGLCGKKEYEIKMEMEDLSEEVFLYGFLRQNFDSISMADLIAISYLDKDYDAFREKTINILEKIQEDVNFRIYINEEEVIVECKTGCKVKEQEFKTILPVPNKEVINFKMVLYETK